MRAFGLTALVFLGILNGFLAYSCQALADELHRTFTHSGIKLSQLSRVALALPPWFYVMGAIAIALASVAFWRRALDRKLVYSAFALLLFDVAGLFTMMWGYGVIWFLM